MSDGIQQQHTQQGYCPSPFKGRRGEKAIKIILSGCWFSITHGVSSNNYCVGQGWEDISCTSQMNFEPAVYIGTGTSFRKASHPNWNKDKWPAGVGCHSSAMHSSWGATCKSWWIDCFFLQLSYAQISPFLNAPAIFSLENLASNTQVKSLLVPFL